MLCVSSSGVGELAAICPNRTIRQIPPAGNHAGKLNICPGSKNKDCMSHGWYTECDREGSDVSLTRVNKWAIGSVYVSVTIKRLVLYAFSHAYNYAVYRLQRS